MYFPDRPAALREMKRVLVAGGRLAVAVWAPFERAKGYVQLAEIAKRHVGDEAEKIIRTTPHQLGYPETLEPLCKESGIENPVITIQDGVYIQPSIDYFLESEVKGSPLYSLFDGESYQAFLEETREALASFLAPSGSIVTKIAIVVDFALGRDNWRLS